VTAVKSIRVRGVPVRERVLRAAEKIFAQRGYGLASMREVAAAAGIQAASVYHHWRSKDALYADVLERANATLRTIVRDALAHDEPLREQLRRVIGEVFNFLVRHPDLARLTLRATLGDGLHKVAATQVYDSRWLGLVEGFLQPLVAKGQVKQIDVTRFLISASAVLNAHAVAYHDRRNPFRRELPGRAMARQTTAHVTQVILRILGLE
jgi:AcrR family transcriptional regulator